MLSSSCGLISQIPLTSARRSGGKSIDAVLTDLDQISRRAADVQLDDVAG